jgi:hypothetical protein
MSVDWNKIFSRPEVASAGIQTAGTLAGAAVAGRAAQAKAEWEKQQSRQDTARNRMFGVVDSKLGQQNANFGMKQGQQDAADRMAMEGHGKSPLDFQQQRLRMDSVANMLESGGPANLRGHLPEWARGMKVRFRPSAEAEAPYWNQLAASSKGRSVSPGLGGIYGASGQGVDDQVAATGTGARNAFGQEWAAHEAATAGIQNQAWEMAAQDYAKSTAQNPTKKKTSFWKKLAKIGIIAGAGLATVMTGGAAGVLIGAAAGAGTGALDGGWKGALMGAGLGAATGGIGGGAGGTAVQAGVRQGLGQAARSVFTNPAMLMQMGGTAVGGPVGTALQMAALGSSLGRPKVPSNLPWRAGVESVQGLGHTVPLGGPPAYGGFGSNRNLFGNVFAPGR